MNVLVVGQDSGRCEAIACKLRESPKVDEVHLRAVPPNGRFDPLVQAALVLHAELVVVAPEEPLVAGIVDYFAQKAPSVNVFGPDRLAAELEGSKIFMKTRCLRWGIETAAFDFAGSVAVAAASIKRNGWRVIKSDGLCSGKGVAVVDTEAEAIDAARAVLAREPRVLLEERLYGDECSVMALCDGKRSLLLPVARDYKRAHDGDRGPNTGGMGAYAPFPGVEAHLREIKDRIINTLVAGMASENRPYRGVLYAGIMLTKEGPKLIEVNCRFGDPEAQVVLPLVKGDLCSLLMGCCAGSPHRLPGMIERAGGASVCVCVADKEYPRVGHRLHSSVGTGATVAEARVEAYRKVSLIPGIERLHYRTDIAAGI